MRGQIAIGLILALVFGLGLLMMVAEIARGLVWIKWLFA
jgi:hypothetical protein